MKLSAREHSVVALIAKGLTYKAIAEALGVGYESVKTYAARIRLKLGVATKVEIAVWAIHSGILGDAGDE